MFNKILKAIGHAGQNTERLIPEYFEFFPLDPKLVLAELNFASEKCLPLDGKKRFLDVGCGPGNIMFVAESLGLVPCGIEYNPALVARAPYPRLEHYSAENTRGIYIKDAFRFTHYGDFDIVYLFCPVSNHNLEVKLENIIESQLKIGAIYIANTKQDNSITENTLFEYIGAEKKLPIWRKKE